MKRSSIGSWAQTPQRLCHSNPLEFLLPLAQAPPLQATELNLRMVKIEGEEEPEFQEVESEFSCLTEEVLSMTSVSPLSNPEGR